MTEQMRTGPEDSGEYDASDESQTETEQERASSETEAERQQTPIREERLTPHKEQHRVGDVQITKDVVEEPRTVRAPVSHEEVSVSQEPVSPRPSEEEPAEQTIRIPLVEEVIRIVREPMVTREIVITKRRVTEEREITGTVRREVAHVDKQGELMKQEPTEPGLEGGESAAGGTSSGSEQ